MDHPLSERFGELVDVHDLYPPTHNAVRPGPFASLRTRRDVESLLLVDGLSPADLKEPTKPHGPPAGAPNLSRADRKLHRAIRTMPCMWDWLRAREEEIISFCLDRVHGRWNEVIERTQTDPWAPRDHHTDVSDDSEAESETVYVSTAGGSRAARSRRGSFEVREVPEFLVWGSCSDSFGRLCLHALCRYYSMRSRTLNDETSDMKVGWSDFYERVQAHWLP